MSRGAVRRSLVASVPGSDAGSDPATHAPSEGPRGQAVDTGTAPLQAEGGDATAENGTATNATAENGTGGNLSLPNGSTPDNATPTVAPPNGTSTPLNGTPTNESFLEGTLLAGNGSNESAPAQNLTVGNNTSVSTNVPELPVVGQPSLIEQLFLTLVIILAVVALRYSVHWAREQYDRDDKNTVLGLLDAGGVAVVTVAGVAAVIELWGWFPILFAAVGSTTTGDSGTQQVALEVVLAVVLLGGAYALTSFLGRVMQVLSTRAGVVTRHQREVIYRTTQVLTYSVVGLAILNLVTGGDIGSLLVGAGFLGIVVGMAARKTLGSVLAGFVLMVSRPFEIGDWIEVDTYEGIVTDITVVNTRIRTAEGEYVVVPNDVIENETLVNRSREGNLRIEVEVGVDYDTDVQQAADLAREELASLDDVEDVPEPQVVLKEFGSSSVLLGARAWIADPSARRRWEARSAMVGAIKRRFDAAGVTIPFPQRTLDGRGDGPPVVAGGATTAEGDAGTGDGADGGAATAATDGAGTDGQDDQGQADAEPASEDEAAADSTDVTVDPDANSDMELSHGTATDELGSPEAIDGQPVPGVPRDGGGDEDDGDGPTTGVDGDGAGPDGDEDEESGTDADEAPAEIDGEPVPGSTEAPSTADGDGSKADGHADGDGDGEANDTDDGDGDGDEDEDGNGDEAGEVR
jgi:small-conductance mechanosensitive channel